ncbi:MAG: DUF3303 domain-containing protein [Promethearchaeota archaeon]|jgi:hypothetical protein
MIFISYWELNPDFDPSELAGVAQTLISKKLWPVEGMKEIAWYVSTGDFWGITIVEADSEEQMVEMAAMWRIAKPGIFKSIKTTPALEIVKTVPLLMKLAQKIKG